MDTRYVALVSMLISGAGLIRVCAYVSQYALWADPKNRVAAACWVIAYVAQVSVSAGVFMAGAITPQTQDAIEVAAIWGASGLCGFYTFWYLRQHAPFSWTGERTSNLSDPH